MNKRRSDSGEEPAELEPSKSQRKREMHHLQALGEELLELGTEHLDGLPLSDTLRAAIADYRRIKSREAMRRQKQYIGKLMRSEATEEIETILQQRRDRHAQRAHNHHRVERWRDKMLAGPAASVVEEFLDAYPNADRQWLKQILRKQAEEQKNNKPPAAARKLFVYLRDTIDLHHANEPAPSSQADIAESTEHTPHP